MYRCQFFVWVVSGFLVCRSVSFACGESRAVPTLHGFQKVKRDALLHSPIRREDLSVPRQFLRNDVQFNHLDAANQR
jgi:hypothetical protein